MDDKALDAITEPKDHRAEIGRTPKGDNTGGYVDIESTQDVGLHQL